MAASLEHVHKTFDVRIDIGVRILQRIAHAGLCREMDDDAKAVAREQRLRWLAVGEVELDEGEIGLTLQDVQTRFFQFWIVIVVHDYQGQRPRGQPTTDVAQHETR